MFTLLGLGLVGTLTLGFPDSYLLTTETTVSVPFAGGASFKVLLILGPVLLIAVRAYLEIYLMHWQRLDAILCRHLHGQTMRVPVVSPLRHPLLRVFSGFVLYPLVPLVLAVFTYKSMVFWHWGIAMLFLTSAVAAPMRQNSAPSPDLEAQRLEALLLEAHEARRAEMLELEKAQREGEQTRAFGYPVKC